MNTAIIRKDELAVSRWSGGTTTELAIYPAGAQYAKRDFMWRLSSAVVEDEESTFTRLEGIERILMVLDGELRLRHNDSDELFLRRFDQTHFKGDWQTVSFGKVTDFNLMMKGAYGRVGVLTTDTHKTLADTGAEDARKFALCTDLFYALDSVIVRYGDFRAELNAGDVLTVNDTVSERAGRSITIEAVKNAKSSLAIVHAEVFYNNPAS